MKQLILLLSLIIFSISGLSAQIIYVAPDSTGVGSIDDPADLQDAVANMQSFGTHYRLATGTYHIDSALVLSHDAVIIEGGFIQDPRGWVKTSMAGATTIHRSGFNSEGENPESQGIIGIDFGFNKAELLVQDIKLIVDSPDPSTYTDSEGFGVSTYGIRLNNNSYYNISRVIMEIGDASPGEDAMPGTHGVNGGNGANGTASIIGGEGGYGASNYGNSIFGGPGGDASLPSDIEALDQSHLNDSFAGPIGTEWQSFTAGTSGIFSKVGLTLEANGEITFKVFEGEGTGGTLLFETLLYASADTMNYEEYLIEEPVELTEGVIYTIEIGDNEIWAYDNDNYAGGISSLGSANDFAFQTYIMGRAEAGLPGSAPIDYSDGGAGGGGGGQSDNTLLAASGFGGPGTWHNGETSIPGVSLYPHNPLYHLIDGGHAMDGVDGMDGVVQDSLYFESYQAGWGTAGTHGQGGMGGAGGAGSLDDDMSDSYSGAGGGGGGSGGLGASMSYGGGGAFGVYIYNNSVNGNITSCKITVGSGGNGGLGASGGFGGSGGFPGNTIGSANPAGNGGDGGDGGKGGNSPDAPNGPSYDYLLVNGVPLNVVETDVLIDTFPVIYAEEGFISFVNYVATSDTPGFWEDHTISTDHYNVSTDDLYNDVVFNDLVYSGFIIAPGSISCPQSTTLYVDKDATGAGTGENWTDAISDLQTALETAEACSNIDEIWMAEGSYYPVRRNRFTFGNFETFNITSDIKIYGGFTGVESHPDERPRLDGQLHPSHRTILSGDRFMDDLDIDGDGLLEEIIHPSDNAFHIMTLEGVSDQTVLDGISFTGGYANGAASGYPRNGGAIYMDGTLYQNDPIIRNAFFQKNGASDHGGAIYIFGNASPYFEYCQFLLNNSSSFGGAIATDANSVPNPTYTCTPYYLNCQFKGNLSTFGGALSNVSWEGGIHNSTIVQCLFSGNKSIIQIGSCIHNFGLFGSSHTKIVNSTFAGNAGRLFNDEYADTEILNSIIYSNHLNGEAVYDGISNNFIIENSIVQGEVPSGTIYDMDPVFVDDYAQNNPSAYIPNIEGDYKVQTCSPALDLGDNQYFISENLDSVDYAQKARFREGHISDPNLDPTEDIIDLGPWESHGPLFFTATKDSTDAYIDLSWEITSSDCNCLEEDPILKQGVTVQLKSGVNLIDSWVIYEEDYTNDNYTFTYRDEVGPDITKDYVLEFKKTGPGTLNCRQVERGSTLPFRQITQMSASDGIRPDSIHLSWQNNSTLTNAFNVFRNGSLIATIQADNTLGHEYNYSDVYTFSDTTSLLNGEVYDYCIETVSTIYQDIYNSNLPEQVCDAGSTLDINFDATDNVYDDKVSMVWNNMSAFADQYRIVRDGITIKSLNTNEDDFDDLMPIYGKESLYGIELLNNNVPIVGSYDIGQVPPNGLVAGRVISLQQKIPVSDVNITLEGQVGDSSYTWTTNTDFKGYFQLDSIFYNEAADFTVTAEYMDESFEVNPFEINLNLNDSRVDDLVFLMDFDIVDTMSLSIIDTFTVSAESDMDLVRLDWQFTQDQLSDTVYFNIYRDSELIAQFYNTDDTTSTISMFYEDLTGIPDSLYSYTLYAYKQIQNELADTSLTSEIIFPAVAPVTLNSVTQDTLDGQLVLDWMHSSQNFNGVRIYRVYETEKMIKDVSADFSAYSYPDHDGRPGVYTEYYMTSYRTVDSIDYESAPSVFIGETFPALDPISIINIESLGYEDMVRLEFEVPLGYNLSYAYQGINIYRSSNGEEEKLASIDKALLLPLQIKSFEDKTGIPLKDYDYEVRPYKLSDGKEFEISSPSAPATFPDVSMPNNAIATPFEGKIVLDWQSPHSSKNTDGFIIYRGEGPAPDSIGTLPYQFSNTFTDYLTNPPVTEDQTYQLATVRYVDDVRYLSPTVNVMAYPPIPDGDEAIFLKNFTASNDQFTHIVLCWEWCDPATQTPFVIRREGVVIDTLDYNSRSYYDYNAPRSINQEYSIETPGIFDDLNFQKVYATGKIPSERSIQGKVYKSDSYAAVEDVEIEVVMTGTVLGGIFTAITKTDSTGFYSISGLPYMPPDFYSVQIFANGVNSDIPSSPKLLGISHTDSTRVYEVNFEDLNTSASASETVSEIEFATAIADPTNMAIHVSWSSASDNFDGFEVYRGTELLGEVLKGQELIWTDTEGVPGILTLYNLRAFKTSTAGRDYSDYATAAADFPILARIENLKATQLIDENKLELTWTHPYDSHDSYVIRRNGIPFHVFTTGNPLMIIDSTAVPGITHNYEITAVKGSYVSEAVSIDATMPEVEPIRSFTLSAPTIDKALELDSISVTSSRNHTLLEWSYEDNAADSFLIYRYIFDGNSKTEEQLIARVSGDARSYEDYTGVINQLYHYDIVPSVIRKNNEFYGQRRIIWADSMVYPLLHPPTGMNITADNSLGVLNIDFTIDFPGGDGYRIYRNDSLIYEILDTSFSETVPIEAFVDRSGIPDAPYNYKARSFAFRQYEGQEPQEFESTEAAEININYPLPPSPVNLRVSKGTYPNKILLAWDYNKAIPVDSFQIERRIPNGSWDLIADLTAGERTYDDLDINFSIPPDNYLEIEYRVKAINKNVSSEWSEDFGYLYNGILIDGIDNVYQELGIEIDIDGDWAVAGSTGYGVNIYHLNDDNTWSLHDTISPESVGVLRQFGCFGCDLSLSGKYLTIAARHHNQGKGAFYVYERDNSNNWNLMHSENPGATDNIDFGYVIDIYDDNSLGGDDYLAVSSRDTTDYLGQVILYRRVGNQWNPIDTIQGDLANSIFDVGYQLSIYKDRMAVGLWEDVEGLKYYSLSASGATFMDFYPNEFMHYIELDGNGSPGTYQLILGNEQQMERVDLITESNGILSLTYDLFQPSTDGDIYGNYAAYGYGNQLELYKKMNNFWSFLRLESPDPNFPSISFGNRVKLSEEFIMVSDHNALNRKGYIDFIPLESTPPSIPIDVEATDGTQSGQVLVSWTEPNDPDVQTYKLFRDGEFLASVPAIAPGNVLTHTDLPSSGLLPGKHYMYQVQSFASGMPSKSIGDEGWMPPNGTISGDLTTLIGNAPVEGGLITAEITVDGDCITYTDTTDILGHYEIEDIYYAAESDVVIRCSYLDHDIISQESASLNPQLDSIVVNLDVNNNSYTNANFLDKTAYAVSGVARYQNTEDCYLDSIKVTRTYSIFQNGTRTRSEEEKYTDENGAFTFVIDPETPGLDSVLFEIENVRYLDIQNGVPQDSICYDFDGVSDNDNIQDDHPDGYLYITDFDLDKLTEIAFLDQTLYPVTINVVNSCGNSLLNGNDQWKITASSRDGCYSKSFMTSDGQLAPNLEVPPKDLVFAVTDVTDYSLNNLVFLDYLVNAPVNINLDSFHIQRPKDMTQAEIMDALTFNIEYHKPAVVSPDMSALSFLCDDIFREAIVVENQSYTIPVSVTEDFSPPCSVSSGYVLVTNDASQDPGPVRLDYDENLQKFQDYNFVAGDPNPVLPHTWNMKFEYFTDSGQFQGSYAHAVFVKGKITLPGSGIFTDANPDKLDLVPIPLYTLRDPPGDQSFASIKTGHSSTKSYSYEDVSGGGAGAYGEIGFNAFGLGFEGSANVSAGRYNGDNTDLNITTSLLQDISTSASEDATGRSASIIVGAGVVMQYGISNDYDISCQGGEAEITETREIEFRPLNINTTWTYTIGFIEELIADATRTIQSIENTGRPLAEKPDGSYYTAEESIGKWTAYKNNWEGIIAHFDNSTNPLYSMTETDFEDDNLYPNMEVESSSSATSLNFEANLWASNLKMALGPNYLDPDYVMDQDDIDTYNNAATAIRELMHVRHFVDEDGNISQEAIDSTYEKWEYTSERFDDVDYFKSLADYNPDEVPAQNLTFSGLTSQTQSYAQEKSNATSSNTNIYFNSDTKLGVVFQTKVDFFAGFGGGVIKKGVDSKNKAGVVTTHNWYSNETYEESNTQFEQIEYTLSDNDPDDEISVTVIKGLEANHTPLFQIVGGQTSCPYEEYTLAKDNPVIQVLDPESGNAGKSASQFFQDPDSPVLFNINITNKSDTQDDRDVEVFLDNSSNPDGAIVKLGGSVLGTQVYSDLGYNIPLTLALTVERGQSYDYRGLRIGVRPACSDTITDYITLNVEFESPCSPVSIVTPDDNWLINGQRSSLIIGLRDYEPQTPNFDSLVLQYRRLGAGTLGALNSGWRTIPYTNIKEESVDNNPVLAMTLDTFNTNNFGPGVTPTYFMVWEPDMGIASLFTDGEYQLRVKSVCNEGNIQSINYSNYINGAIYRSDIQVFGIQPADGVWVPGDQVSVQFTKNIDCSLLNDSDFYRDNLRVFVADTSVYSILYPETHPTFTCFNNEIRMTVPDMSIYDGQVMTVEVEDIQDFNGNFAIQRDAFGNENSTISWDFLVVTSKAYWEQDSIVVNLYEGETINLTAGLRNTDAQSALTGINLVRNSDSASWLSIDPDTASTFDVNPSAVKQVSLSFTGVSEGVYYDTLEVAGLPGSGIIPKLPIKLVISKEPPYPPDWTVDSDQYPNSMTVVANYRIDEGPLSTDTLDQISVWIDNTLRGLGQIQKAGEAYVAYLTVYGNSDDQGDTLEFRVWDQSTDSEYDAFTDPEIIYSDNAFKGSTFNPRILEIDSIADIRNRYIYLNQGYTWISFNTEREDMSVNNILSSLTQVTPGDRVLGQYGFTEYINSDIGWIDDFSAIDPPSPLEGYYAVLDSFTTEEAYMVYLQNGPDSIRIRGIDAQQYTKLFSSGTHWVGFPSPVNLTLEEAIGVNDLSNVDQIKNKDESRINNDTIWTSGLLTEMKPNEGYKLLLGSDKVVSIPGSSASGIVNDPHDFVMKSSGVPANPNDPTTWIMDSDDYTFTDVIPVVGRLEINGGDTVLADGIKKVGAFIDGELRGVSLVNDVTQLNDHLFTLFIGKDDSDNGAIVNFYYYDGATVSHTLQLDISTLTINGHGVYNFISPLIWDVTPVIDECPDNLVLTAADGPLDGLYEAKMTITVNENVTILNGANVTLSAPEVILNIIDTQSAGTFEVIQTGCN